MFIILIKNNPNTLIKAQNALPLYLILLKFTTLLRLFLQWMLLLKVGPSISGSWW